MCDVAEQTDADVGTDTESALTPQPPLPAAGEGGTNHPLPSPTLGRGAGGEGIPATGSAVKVGEVFSPGPLEFDKVREMLAGRTSFSAGRELALALTPSPDAFLVERWQAATDEARRLPSLKPGLTLGGAHDIRPV